MFEELLPYLGIAIIIAVAVSAIILLRKQGLFLRRVKHGETELEFESIDNIEDKNQISPQDTRTESVPTLERIIIAGRAINDCKHLDLTVDELKIFILKEGKNHKEMFESSFTSLPLLYTGYVLILTWNQSIATVERIVSRTDAYKFNDAWSTCLATYRQALLLPYRTKDGAKSQLRTQFKRSIKHYEALEKQLEAYINLLKGEQLDVDIPNIHFKSLLEEAKMALANEDFSSCISSMEAFLSYSHKLIIDYVPRGYSGQIRPAKKISKGENLEKDQPCVLVVDDQEVMTDLIEAILNPNKLNFPVIVVNTSSEALVAIVEHKIQVAIIDLVLMGNMDGREIAISVRRANPDALIVLISGYKNIVKKAKLDSKSNPFDLFLPKPFSVTELITLFDHYYSGGFIDRDSQQKPQEESF